MIISLIGASDVRSLRVERFRTPLYRLPVATGRIPSMWPPILLGKLSRIVLLHSLGGLHPVYKTISERLAGEVSVAIAHEWQTFEQAPEDAVVT